PAADDDQPDEGGEEDAETERDRHRDEEARLEAPLEEDRRQPGESRQGGEENGTKTSYSRLANGLGERKRSILSAPIDEIDEHEAVVDEDSDERDHSEERDERELRSDDGVAPDRAGDPEGDGAHDDERLEVG